LGAFLSDERYQQNLNRFWAGHGLQQTLSLWAAYYFFKGFTVYKCGWALCTVITTVMSFWGTFFFYVWWTLGTFHFIAPVLRVELDEGLLSWLLAEKPGLAGFKWWHYGNAISLDIKASLQYILEGYFCFSWKSSLLIRKYDPQLSF
jgi:hypothetical protein